VIFIFVKITFIPACLVIVVWFLTQVINAGQVTQAQSGGVAYLAHIGGFIYGVAIARLFQRSRGIVGEGT
jgi:membrane associated rhomboid family serine protease